MGIFRRLSDLVKGIRRVDSLSEFGKALSWSDDSIVYAEKLKERRGLGYPDRLRYFIRLSCFKGKRRTIFDKVVFSGDSDDDPAELNGGDDFNARYIVSVDELMGRLAFWASEACPIFLNGETPLDEGTLSYLIRYATISEILPFWENAGERTKELKLY